MYEHVLVVIQYLINLINLRNPIPALYIVEKEKNKGVVRDAVLISPVLIEIRANSKAALFNLFELSRSELQCCTQAVKCSKVK